MSNRSTNRPLDTVDRITPFARCSFLYHLSHAVSSNLVVVATASGVVVEVIGDISSIAAAAVAALVTLEPSVPISRGGSISVPSTTLSHPIVMRYVCRAVFQAV